jgi:uncharacterized repeat protein (TIGR01451 family)
MAQQKVAMKLSRVLTSALLVLASTQAFGLGTVAGTNIQNTAQVSYSIGGNAITTSSNTSSITVAEVLDVDVTTLSATVLVTPGSTQQEIALRITNTGNGSEPFRLTLNSNVAGDQFDPVQRPTAVYFDSDGSGDFSAADVAYSPGTNDPVLAPDASVVVLVVHDIPPSVADGQRGLVELTARSITTLSAATVTAGMVFPNAGTGGVDAVAGSTLGQDTAQGAYQVASVQINAVKSQTIADPFGGTRPVPGARIDYRIDVTVTGAGTATGVIVADDIPPNTTYVAGSLRLNGAALTDDADADAGQFITTPTNQVRIALGDLTGAAGTQTLEFTVTIN